MKKKYFLPFWVALMLGFLSCNESNEEPVVVNPFDTISVSSNDARDKIVVITRKVIRRLPLSTVIATISFVP